MNHTLELEIRGIIPKLCSFDRRLSWSGYSFSFVKNRCNISQGFGAFFVLIMRPTLVPFYVLSNMNVNLTAFIDSLGLCISHFLISFPLSVSDVIENVQQNHRKTLLFPVLKLLTRRLPVNFSSQSDFDSSAFWHWLSQRSCILGADQKECSLWERDCISARRQSRARS